MNWRWISLAALLAALVIGYGTLIERREPPLLSDTEPQQPGYYLKDAVISEMQEDGALGIRLITDRAEQRSQDDGIVLSKVRVRYFQAPGEQWILSARQGFVPARSRVLDLTGNVELRPADAAPQSFLRTEALAIDTVRNLAYSKSSPVEIRFGQHSMQVQRFVADLKTQKIRLERVNGRFEPQ